MVLPLLLNNMNGMYFYGDYSFNPILCKDPMKIWYYSILEQFLTSMFDYENLPEGLERKYIEHTLIRYGCCGIKKIPDGKFFVGVPSITPPLDNYGIGTKIRLTTYNGQYQVEGTIGEDCVLIWNNSEFICDYGIVWFADMFKEVDKSMKANVINTRLHPIPVAKTSKLKDTIDRIFKSIKGDDDISEKDQTYTVVNEQAFADVINGDSKSIDVINLTDVKDVDKLQYLSKFHDDLLRRFATLYGHPMQTSGKMAQQTSEELQGYNTFSMVDPYNRLEERQKGIEEFNRIFNTDVKITFGKAWTQNMSLENNNIKNSDVQESEVNVNEPGNIE